MAPLYSTREGKQPNILTRAVNKVSSWLRPNKSNQISPLGTTTSDLIKKQRDTDVWPFPFGSIERAVNRELNIEKRKAKPLIRQAERLLHNDPDVVAALGEPIVIGSMVSQSKSTTVVNRRRSQQIWDSFQVAGPRNRGVATLVADKYAKGHLQSLRVVIDGIKYDIDV